MAKRVVAPAGTSLAAGALRYMIIRSASSATAVRKCARKKRLLLRSRGLRSWWTDTGRFNCFREGTLPELKHRLNRGVSAKFRNNEILQMKAFCESRSCFSLCFFCAVIAGIACCTIFISSRGGTA